MKKHLNIIAVSMLMLAMAVPSMAQQPVVEWTDEALVLQYEVQPEHVGRDYSYVAVSKLCTQQDTIDLNTQIWRGRRNAKKYNRDLLFNKRLNRTDYLSLKGSEPHVVNASLSYTDYPWLREHPLSLLLQSEKEGCCRTQSLPDTILKRFAYVPPFEPLTVPVEEFHGKVRKLKMEYPFLRHISEYHAEDPSKNLYDGHKGLYVYFPVNSISLDGTFSSNAEVLEEVIESTRLVMADSVTSVKKILIAGLASPDGPAKKNEWLAGERALALKKYIQQTLPNVPDSVFQLVNCGEGWDALRTLVEKSDMTERSEVLGIIDNVKNEWQREHLLKVMNHGKTYDYLKNTLLKEQRNSGYFMIYYDAIHDENAQTINQALDWMEQKRYNEALILLQTVKDDPRSYNALGTVLMELGQRTEACRYLQLAAENGDDEARQNLELIHRIEQAEQVSLEQE